MSAVTTSAVTTSAVTTSAVTTSAVTTSAVTTSAVTTSAVTTSAVTRGFESETRAALPMPARRRWLVALTAGFMGFGCGGAITPILAVAATHQPSIAAECDRVFPKPPFEATHVVEAKLPMSDDTSLIGVVSANTESFRSVLLSQEGVVLFDAVRRADDLHVKRAVPPIDPEGFGRHMTGDVGLMLIRPVGAPSDVGLTHSGTKICRWTRRAKAGEEIVEVELDAPRAARLRRFLDGRLERSARLTAIDERGYAHDAVLETTGLIGYELHLTLLSADDGSKGSTEAAESGGADAAAESSGADADTESGGAGAAAENGVR
jgi:hypothetical protein